MSAVLNAVPEPNDDAEQLSWIEGFPAAGTRFSLKSTANLWTDRKLSVDDRVSFTGSGVVDGVHTARQKDGALFYVYDIRVDDAELT